MHLVWDLYTGHGFWFYSVIFNMFVQDLRVKKFLIWTNTVWLNRNLLLMMKRMKPKISCTMTLCCENCSKRQVRCAKGTGVGLEGSLKSSFQLKIFILFYFLESETLTLTWFFFSYVDFSVMSLRHWLKWHCLYCKANYHVPK